MSEINRLKRRMVNFSSKPDCYGPPAPDPVAEWDRRRQYLAEELLKILVDDASWDAPELTDGLTIAQLKALAAAALAAAEVIYPEMPLPPLMEVTRDGFAAARAGAATVMPTTVTPTGD